MDRRIKISVRRDAIGDIEIYYAGLHHYAGVGEIHFQDFVHAGQADYDSFSTGRAPPLSPVPERGLRREFFRGGRRE